MNPYLFIVGCPRSGTTMLERMVNAHPDIAIIHETHWITQFFKKQIGLDQSGFVNLKLIDALTRHHRFPLLNTTRDELEQILKDRDGATGYADFVARIFDNYGKKAGKKWVGDKTTGGYLRNLKLLHRLFPVARFVHLIRDGRNVCLSMLNWKKSDRAAGRLAIWNDDPVATTALWWQWHIHKGLKNAARIPANLYQEIRYESLVIDPENVCRQLCTFADVPYHDAMINFHQGKTLEGPGLTANRAWLPPTPNLRDWTTQLARDDIEMFEAIAGETLADLGYPLMFESISGEVKNKAARFQIWWNTQHEVGRSRQNAAGLRLPRGRNWPSFRDNR